MEKKKKMFTLPRLELRPLGRPSRYTDCAIPAPNVQTVASRYTDYAIHALAMTVIFSNSIYLQGSYLKFVLLVLFFYC
jgi:hypothetical protein